MDSINYISLSLLVIIISFACGCASSDVQTSSTQKFVTSSATFVTLTPIPEYNIDQDFSSIALTKNDLPHGWMTTIGPIKNETMYRSEFFYTVGSPGIQLIFTIEKYSAVDDAKNVFQQKKSINSNLEVDALDIGKEGFGYESGGMTGVVFRNGNLIISFYTTTYPPVSVNDLSTFAKKVNSKINPPSLSTTHPDPKFKYGDVIGQTPLTSDTDSLWVIYGYDSKKDEYAADVMFRNKDGTWGHWGLLHNVAPTFKREDIEKDSPILIGHIDPSTIPTNDPTKSN